MTRFAYFDSTAPTPSPVLGWYDDEVVKHDAMPKPENLLEVSDADWALHESNPELMLAVSHDDLIPYVPPPPPGTPSERASEKSAAMIGAGITVTSASHPESDGTYPLTPEQSDYIATEVLHAAEFTVFKNGLERIHIRDIDGIGRWFTIPVLRALHGAMALRLTAIMREADVLIQGGDPEWPTEVVELG